MPLKGFVVVIQRRRTATSRAKKSKKVCRLVSKILFLYQKQHQLTDHLRSHGCSEAGMYSEDHKIFSLRLLICHCPENVDQNSVEFFGRYFQCMKAGKIRGTWKVSLFRRNILFYGSQILTLLQMLEKILLLHAVIKNDANETNHFVDKFSQIRLTNVAHSILTVIVIRLKY